MDIYTHKHHIIPRHMGGTDDPSNLVELTIEEHAQAHERLYEEHGHDQDRVAARMLRGQISHYDAFIEMVRRPKSEKWKKEMSERNSGEGNPFYGKKQSQKQKDAVSRALKGIPQPHKSAMYKERYANGEHSVPVLKGVDNGMSRAVLVGDQRYDTVTQAAEAHGVSRVTARRRLTVDTFPDWNYE